MSVNEEGEHENDAPPAGRTQEEYLRDKIIFVLTEYPILSPSMLQIGLGTGVAPARWRPILNQLIAEGRVVRFEECASPPSGGSKFYTKLRLQQTIAA